MAMTGSVVLLVACHVAAALVGLGWTTAVATDMLAAVYLAALCVRPEWRAILARLFLVGIIAGVIELATDAAGQYVAHSLVYPPDEPFLWASPIYMPLSWAIVSTQLGYLGWRLRNRIPPVRMALAVLVSFAAGAVLVPFYEEMAFLAGWWRYTSFPVISHVPVYVILFEGLVSAAFPLLLNGLGRKSLARTALAGLAIGAWMPVAAFLTWSVIGR
jgi:hypothetical protein